MAKQNNDDDDNGEGFGLDQLELWLHAEALGGMAAAPEQWITILGVKPRDPQKIAEAFAETAERLAAASADRIRASLDDEEEEES